MTELTPSLLTPQTRDKNTRTLTPIKEETANRYNAVKKRYNELRAVLHEGMRLRHDDIVTKIGNEYFLKPATVEHILARAN